MIVPSKRRLTPRKRRRLFASAARTKTIHERGNVSHANNKRYRNNNTCAKQPIAPVQYRRSGCNNPRRPSAPPIVKIKNDSTAYVFSSLRARNFPKFQYDVTTYGRTRAHGPQSIVETRGLHVSQRIRLRLLPTIL